MKKLTMILLALLVVPSKAGWTQIIDGYMDPPWPSDREQKTEQTPANEEADAKDLKKPGTANMVFMAVQGTAVAVIPNAESLTVLDSVTGTSRMFRAEKNQILHIKPGDNISVTPQDNDPRRVKSIEKRGGFY
jgi:hypothetical protein